jgi:3-deoxy-7-phosphoheptulonate synthase
MPNRNTATSEGWYAHSEKTSQTDDQRIKDVTPLPPPEHLIKFFPIAGTAVEKLVGDTRQAVRRILHGEDDRLLVIIGPCSIHDPAAALEYARRLKAERERYADTLEVVMRVYFEKPRTTVGWKGLINDPYLDESYRIHEGLRIARQLLLEINRSGVPAASEFLDVISPQYIADLVSWGAIGARTTESQVHRELASGLSAPIGFKNGTDGNIRIAVDAIKAASSPHHFLSITKGGHSAIVSTNGNEDCHVILRGGREPNYDAVSVEAACRALGAAGLAHRCTARLCRLRRPCRLGPLRFSPLASGLLLLRSCAGWRGFWSPCYVLGRAQQLGQWVAALAPALGCQRQRAAAATAARRATRRLEHTEELVVAR